MTTLQAAQSAGAVSGCGSVVAAEAVRIVVGGVALPGELSVPQNARGLVLAIVASGYIRENPRHADLTRALQARGFATLVFRLLTTAEAGKDEHTGFWSFNLELLSSRLAAATEWARRERRLRDLAIGYIATSTGAAAALVAAAQLGPVVQAVVCRGGRPDLAEDYLSRVTASCLLLVGEKDELIRDLNRQAYDRLRCRRELAIVPGAQHLFNEPGAWENVAIRAVDWFSAHLPAPAAGGHGRLLSLA